MDHSSTAPFQLNGESFAFGVQTDYMARNLEERDLSNLQSVILETAKGGTTFTTDNEPDFSDSDIHENGKSFSRWKNSLSNQLRFHMHDYCQITCLVKGRCLYLINNHQVEVKAGDILIINRNILHSWLAIEDTQNTYITFDSDQLQSFSPHYANYEELLHILYSHQCPYTLVCAEEPFYPQIKHIFLQIIDEAAQKQSFYQAVIQNQLMHLSLLLIRFCLNVSMEIKQGNNYSEVIKQALEYISQNLSTISSVEEIAGHLHTNPCYFSHLFKKTLGVSCTKYISFERLSKAAEKLRDTDENIISICMECGFNSMSSFYRQFTMMHSLPPAKYRKLLRDDPSSLDSASGNAVDK